MAKLIDLYYLMKVLKMTDHFQVVYLIIKTLFGGVQPGIIAELIRADDDQGYYTRLLIKQIVIELK